MFKLMVDTFPICQSSVSIPQLSHLANASHMTCHSRLPCAYEQHDRHTLNHDIPSYCVPQMEVDCSLLNAYYYSTLSRYDITLALKIEVGIVLVL